MNMDADYDLRALSGHFPVPADCPAFTTALGIKRGGSLVWWNPDYVPYKGKPEWCSKCPIFGSYCDGNNCKIKLEKEYDEEEELGD